MRDDLRALAASDRPLPLTLALNQLDEGAALPPQVYTLALAVESDARVLARRMRADNVQNAIVIGGDAPLMKRFANAFAARVAAGRRRRRRTASPSMPRPTALACCDASSRRPRPMAR